MRQPPLKPSEAPDRAPPSARPPREARALCGRNLAMRNRRQNFEQQLAEILGRVYRGEVDPETLRRVYGRERRRQQLQNERPQQMRFAVEQVRQCLPAQRPRHKVRHTPSGIADATGATLWVARAALDEAFRARPRARGSEINTKWLR